VRRAHAIAAVCRKAPKRVRRAHAIAAVCRKPPKRVRRAHAIAAVCRKPPKRVRRAHANLLSAADRAPPGFAQGAAGYPPSEHEEGRAMYIGMGTLILILVVLILLT
jgi:hypothetical protein